MSDIINSILRLNLCPLQVTQQGNDYYEPLFRQLGTVAEQFDAAYTIQFSVPIFSGKVKYYKRLIDNAIASELNKQLMDGNNKDVNIISFRRKKLDETIQAYLIDTKQIIERNHLDLGYVLNAQDYSQKPHINECTFIFHYLILALIRCYMEFQKHFIDFIDADKQKSIADFFVQVLQWKVPDKIGINEIQKIEIQAENKPLTKEISAKEEQALSFTYTLLSSESQNINLLFVELKKHGAIPQNFQITEFKHLFSGVKVEKPIIWIGNKSDLAYLFKLLVNEKQVLMIPPNTTIWDIVDACFVDQDGNHFGKDTLRKQQKPKRTAKKIEILANSMT